MQTPNDPRHARALAATSLDETVAALRPEAAEVPAPGTQVKLTLAHMRTITVTAGEVDEAARDAYRNGQCHALAVALAQATGWPLVWIGYAECTYEADCSDYDFDTPEDEWEWCPCQILHLGVTAPDGSFVDVNGAQDADELTSEWSEEEGWDMDWFTLTGEQLRHLLVTPNWRAPDVATATAMVPAVLAQLDEAPALVDAAVTAA